MKQIGNTEDRINKCMRMCLEWQYDLKRGVEKNPTYYYTKYHVGKCSKKFFEDLAYSVVDRRYVIDKMNMISEHRFKSCENVGTKSNRVIIKEVEIPNYSIWHKTKSIKLDDKTIVKTVAKSRYYVQNTESEN